VGTCRASYSSICKKHSAFPSKERLSEAVLAPLRECFLAVSGVLQLMPQDLYRQCTAMMKTINDISHTTRAAGTRGSSEIGSLGFRSPHLIRLLLFLLLCVRVCSL